VIEQVLVLSTEHLPEEDTDVFGDLRFVEHMYGYIVFVPHSADECPHLLKPIVQRAIDTESFLIVFDEGADIVEEFDSWERL